MNGHEIDWDRIGRIYEAFESGLLPSTPQEWECGSRKAMLDLLHELSEEDFRRARETGRLHAPQSNDD